MQREKHDRKVYCHVSSQKAWTIPNVQFLWVSGG